MQRAIVDRSLYAVRLDVAGLAWMEVRRRRTGPCLREVIAAFRDRAPALIVEQLMTPHGN